MENSSKKSTDKVNNKKSCAASLPETARNKKSLQNIANVPNQDKTPTSSEVKSINNAIQKKKKKKKSYYPREELAKIKDIPITSVEQAIADFFADMSPFSPVVEEAQVEPNGVLDYFDTPLETCSQHFLSWSSFPRGPVHAVIQNHSLFNPTQESGGNLMAAPSSSPSFAEQPHFAPYGVPDHLSTPKDPRWPRSITWSEPVTGRNGQNSSIASTKQANLGSTAVSSSQPSIVEQTISPSPLSGSSNSLCNQDPEAIKNSTDRDNAEEDDLSTVKAQPKYTSSTIPSSPPSGSSNSFCHQDSEAMKNSTDRDNAEEDDLSAVKAQPKCPSSIQSSMAPDPEEQGTGIQNTPEIQK